MLISWTYWTQVSFKGFGIEESKLNPSVPFEFENKTYTLRHGSVVIAAITSCTNTSNPSVMLGAGKIDFFLCHWYYHFFIIIPSTISFTFLIRIAGQKSCRSRANGSTVHQNIIVARIRCSDILPPRIRSGSSAGEAGLQHRRLRLYDLYRQQWTHSWSCQRSHWKERFSVLRRFVRQSKLRRAHSPQHPRQLFGISAARRRICYCRYSFNFFHYYLVEMIAES